MFKFVFIVGLLFLSNSLGQRGILFHQYIAKGIIYVQAEMKAMDVAEPTAKAKPTSNTSI